jgi:hypothetical protein
MNVLTTLNVRAPLLSGIWKVYVVTYYTYYIQTPIIRLSVEFYLIPTT